MLRRTLLTAAPAALALPAAAQDWPTAPIRGVVPFAAGSATDIVARLFAERMREGLGQPVVVENRAGASGLIGAEAVARATPDGNTILFGTNSTNAAANALFRRVPFDMERDFAPISLLASVPLLVAVAANSPHRTLNDLLTAARARPEAVTFASASSSQRVATEMLASMAQARMLHVPYRSSPAAVQDLIAGRVDLFVADQAVILPAAQAGQLRVLGVTTRGRSPQLPEIPTVAEAGNLPSYELFAWFVLVAPAGTPTPHIARLNAAVRQASANPELRQRLEQVLGMTVTPSTPEEAQAFMRSETVKWTNAIRAAGIEPE
ncbi:Bug family tripartite tricarboxylate transporter substrate binding protein [Sediminicoccus rosea]|jgi:tripartite-type tricarboxylate transporter receptor subunit TctC|uniref:Tripartite tricarboxylate transporter substrate binding protein n=1 Tax=Sediminicoccus rosea TaxID=1225128 RepID=A0ABZ0PES8_9PROT|nr:tripartite tricarboxylate transporter substrate binding protein [Sediminicoccus rosea]WPB84125.1 tripartite tricarboxylate transporter substrate binding protein [Sediminicoccus rosea]